MLKSKLLSMLLALAIVTMPLAAVADASGGCKEADPILAWTVGLPFKVVGAALSSATGLLVGTTTGLFRGAVHGTKAVAGALGDEDGAGETLVGILLGAAPGAAIHAVVGGLLWAGKGFVAGLTKPFECESLSSALGGIPDAIEWTAEGAVEAFS